MRRKIENYLRAGYSGLYVISHEEARVEAEIKAVCETVGFTLHVWDVANGIVSEAGVPVPDTADPVSMLEAFAKLPEKSLLLAKDIHLFLGDPNPLVIRRVKDAVRIGKMSNRVLLALGCQLKLVPELEKEITVVEFKLPDRATRLKVLQGIADSAAIALNGNTEALLEASSGLTVIESENAFALSVVEGKDILPEIVAREKAATVRKAGILEIVETKLGLADIGGLEHLKEWLSKRKAAFSAKAKEYGLPMPKGFIAVGIPGTGKSLVAKATASILGVPLLRMDGGKIFGSLVGESERNLRSAIATAEAIAPCCLQIEELEKAFAGSASSGATDGGTSARVFGSLLTWLQEKTAPVFVVATANDVSQLPDELLRAGRWDSLWYVDLPNETEREDIWRIQIAKHGRKPDAYSIAHLAKATDSFTGAEIESIFTEALFNAFDEGMEPSEMHIGAAIQNTVPLSKTMAGTIEALRQWAQGRARRASPLINPMAQTQRKLMNN